MQFISIDQDLFMLCDLLKYRQFIQHLQNLDTKSNLAIVRGAIYSTIKRKYLKKFIIYLNTYIPSKICKTVIKLNHNESLLNVKNKIK